MSVPQYVQGPDGRMRGSIGTGRDRVPDPATAPTTTPESVTPVVDLADVVARLQALPGITVTDAGDDWEDATAADADLNPLDTRRAADEGAYGPGAGGNYWNPNEQRCGRCDSRYCVDACHAGQRGWVYVTGHGYLRFRDADAVELAWVAAGLVPGVDFGPEHPSRRVEWHPGAAGDRYAAPAA